MSGMQCALCLGREKKHDPIPLPNQIGVAGAIHRLSLGGGVARQLIKKGVSIFCEIMVLQHVDVAF